MYVSAVFSFFFCSTVEFSCCSPCYFCNNCQQAVLIKMETVQRALSVTDSVVS